MEQLQHLVLGLIDHYGLPGLFVGMTLGNIGAPVGAEIVMPAAGALVATGHLPNVWFTIMAAVLGELAGQSIGYAVGRFGGRPLVEKYGKYVRFDHAHLDKVDAFFDKYGTFAIFICRFVPVIRGIVGIPAGIVRMHLVPFYLWTLAGSVVFCGGLIWLGMALGDHLDQISPWIHKFGIGILAVVVLGLAAYGLYVWLRSRKKAQA